MELINKQYALASAISGIFITDENDEKWIRVRDVRESIMNVPIIEAEPIRHGRWVPVTKGAIKEIYICSRCHRKIEDAGIPALIPMRYPYCHCGAKMDGEGDV